MFAQLLPLPLLLLLAALRAGRVVADEPRTFTVTDPKTGETLVCDRCPPGEYLSASCTSTTKSACAPCPAGSFTELWNHIDRCLRCDVCSHKQVVKTPCRADRNCQCECKQGYYYRKRVDMCVPHSDCPSGHRVLTPGTADADTVCHVCPNGTFSTGSSARQNCTGHRRCAAGQQLVLRGSTWHDSVCASREDLTSRDGASFLREILPAFFLHQRVPGRRLCRILDALCSEDCEKNGFHSLSLSELNAQLNTWVASASEDQIRQLPEILKATGAYGAGLKLQRELLTIDGTLNKLSPLGNSLDAVLLSA